uniref:Uncharacterized protein n=1 Tax=Mycobacterium riyadhense TaxID=486698 RepID=A0A653F3R6_9MYCO|nr:hypothetical protein BIN_B_05511 [Mycobacterium riyadhense]
MAARAADSAGIACPAVARVALAAAATLAAGAAVAADAVGRA